MSSSSHFRFFFPPLKVTSLHWQQQSPFINIVDLALFTASARRSRTGRSTRRPSPAAEWQRTCSPRIVETALLRPGRTSTLLLSAQRGNWVLLSSLLQHLGSFVPKKKQDQLYRDKTSHYVDLNGYDICEEAKGIKNASNVLVISSSDIEKSFFDTVRTPYDPLFLRNLTGFYANRVVSTCRPRRRRT